MGSGSASCCPQTDPDASESVTNLRGYGALDAKGISQHRYFDIAVHPKNHSSIKLSRITDMCKARTALIEELIEKEDAHIEILMHISNTFLKPLSERVDFPDKFSRQFDILDDLRRDHAQFLVGLKKTNNIPAYIQDNMDFVKNYSKFINEYNFISNQIMEYSADSNLEQIMQHGLLSSSLIKVLARPFEYKNWIERLLKQTQHDHWQQKELLLAQSQVNFVHDHLLEAELENERVMKLLAISKKIQGFDVSYNKKRSLILDCDCQYRLKAKKFEKGKAVIFSDLGLVCDEKYKVIESLEKYTNFEHFKHASKSYGLRLFAKNDRTKDPLEFFAESESMLRHWENTLRENMT